MTKNVGLVIVDMQCDFITGSLAGHNGLQIIPMINELISSREWGKIIYTRDWHPLDHCSFASNYKDGKNPPFTSVHIDVNNTDQVLWPDHCVQGTNGAEFHKDLVCDFATVISKGTHQMVESYSCFSKQLENPEHFEKTGMEGCIDGLTTLVFVGMCYDYCVGSSALDSVVNGRTTLIIEDHTGYVLEGSHEEMTPKLHAAGVKIMKTREECLAWLDTNPN
jgi:nicotinamidase/pyrazinamidase